MIRDFNVRGFVLLLRLVVIAVSVAGFGGSTAAQARQEKKEPAALPVPESKLAEKSKQFESLAPSIEIRNVTIEKSEYGMIFRVTVRNLVDEGVLAYCFYLRGSDPDSGAFTSAFKPLRPEAQEFAIGPLAEQVIELEFGEYIPYYRLTLKAVLFESNRGEGDVDESDRMRDFIVSPDMYKPATLQEPPNEQLR